MIKKNVAIILIILIALLLVAAVVWIYNQRIAEINKRYGYRSEKGIVSALPVSNDELKGLHLTFCLNQ